MRYDRLAKELNKSSIFAFSHDHGLPNTSPWKEHADDYQLVMVKAQAFGRILIDSKYTYEM